MSVSKMIIEYVNKLGPGQIFVTRHLLPIATRAAIDTALCRLVKKQWLLRLARGVFCKKIESAALPKISEIVKVKARAFGKTIVTHGSNALCELGFSPVQNEEICFASNGKSSSFVVLGIRVYLKGTSMNRVSAGNGRPGLAIRAMAHLRRAAVVPNVISALCQKFDRSDQIQLKQKFPPLMTGWMSDIIAHAGIPLGVT